MDISELKRLNYIVPDKRHPWEAARGRIIVHFLKKYLANKPASIADIGSGDGYIYSLLAQKNLVTGYAAIDTAYTEEIVENLKKQTGATPVSFYTTITRYLQARTQPPAVYLCLDVLEHLEQEKDVLEPITANTPSQPAWYIFTVPAFNTLFSAHDTLLGHYRRYTQKQLCSLCKQYGLEVIESGYFFFSLLMGRWLEKKLSVQPKKTIDNWNKGKLATALFTHLLLLDFRIGRIFKFTGIHIPGLSCYCICQKQPS